jgi:hypothetical protein
VTQRSGLQCACGRDRAKRAEDAAARKTRQAVMRSCSPACTAPGMSKASRWGDELVMRYRDALERFAALFGVGRA